MSRFLFILMSVFLSVQAFSLKYEYEGVFPNGEKKTINNCFDFVTYYLPYNPVIVEIGGFEGANAVELAKKYPRGHIIVFEPEENSFKKLLKNTQSFNNISAYNLAIGSYLGKANLYISNSIDSCNNFVKQFHEYVIANNICGMNSLLKPKKAIFHSSSVEVFCDSLDNWCQKNSLDHIDFLRLDAEGVELQILRSSPQILKTVWVISTKTNFFAYRDGTTLYPELKNFLEMNQFELLAHWFYSGQQGEAIFIKKCIYDSLFR
jgi:FkbM family methyltransferase